MHGSRRLCFGEPISGGRNAEPHVARSALGLADGPDPPDHGANLNIDSAASASSAPSRSHRVRCSSKMPGHIGWI